MDVALKRGGAVHGGIFLAAVCAAALVSPPLPWPWYLLLPLLAYGGVALLFAPLRRTAPVIGIGRMSGAPLVYAAILIAGTTGVLVAFHAWDRPDVTELAGPHSGRSLRKLAPRGDILQRPQRGAGGGGLPRRAVGGDCTGVEQ